MPRTAIVFILAAMLFAAQGCKKDHPKSPDKFITAFYFAAADNPGLGKNVSGVIKGDSILVALPKSSNAANLVPTISFVGARMTPASGQTQNFSTPVTYTVTAQDGSTAAYTVATRTLSSTSSIVSFQFRPADNPGLDTTLSGVITGDTIVVPFNSTLPLNNLVPYITYNGVSISPAGGSPMDFSQPDTFSVYAEDGTRRKYTVFVSINRMIYVGADDGNLYAIDAASGALHWKYSTGGGIRSSATVDHGVLYVGSSDGFFYALNAGDGSLKWKHEFDHAIGSSPTVNGATVYVNASGYTNALDTATGNIIWQTPTSSQLPTYNGSPTVAYGLLFTGTWEGPFTNGALNASNGALQWSILPGESYTNPAVVNGIVYTADADAIKLKAVDAYTGAVKWSYYDYHFGSVTAPTVAQGKVFFTDPYGYLYAIDSATGSLIWKTESLGAVQAGFQPSNYIVGVFSDPIVAGGIVYVGCNDGFIYAVDATTGQIKWHFGAGIGSYPGPPEVTVANGVVYCGSPWGNIYALDASDLATIWQIQTGVGVYTGPCVTDATGRVFHPGVSGDQQ
jgi:outer membrane protein assembly factor BamB